GRAERLQRFDRRRSDVEHHQLEALLPQVGGHALAHPAEADEADRLHCYAPVFPLVPGRTASPVRSDVSAASAASRPRPASRMVTMVDRSPDRMQSTKCDSSTSSMSSGAPRRSMVCGFAPYWRSPTPTSSSTPPCEPTTSRRSGGVSIPGKVQA